MKRKILYSFIFVMLVVGLTGCKKEEANNETIDAAFTITCTDEKNNDTGIEIQNKTTYYFEENQYMIGSSVTTTQVFKDKNVYNEYKSAQEETVANGSSDDVTYSLNANDKKMTLVFTMTIKNNDVNNATTEEEKNNYKASTILNKNENSNLTCKVNGIDKSKLK